jgi:hypothetical protein
MLKRAKQLFLLAISKLVAMRRPGGLCAPRLILLLKLYLTGFLKRTFPGENALNRAFCLGKTQWR